jgi:nucleotide-binding universal stress UspA family protein
MSVSVKRVLVANDFSAGADAALQHGCAAARAYGASLDVLHVVSDPLEQAPTTAEGYVVPNDFNQKLEASVRRHVMETLSQACGTWLAVEVLVRHGTPADEILKAARERRADLVVVGRHGHRLLERLLLGTTAERVVREAPCPVLTVHAADGRP